MSAPRYRLAEVFLSCQAEGAWSGTPALFLRFAGCNLSCGFCDTDHSHRLSCETPEDLGRLLRETLLCGGVPMVREKGLLHVVVTGGEPLMQLDGEAFDAILTACHPRPCMVHVETNGTLVPLPGLDLRRCWVTWSPKSEDDPCCLPEVHEVKLLIPGPVRLEWAEQAEPKALHRWLQPLDPLSKTGTFPFPAASLQREENVRKCINLATMFPEWKVSYQWHKAAGIR